MAVRADGSLILTGGEGWASFNDVWASHDGGANWEELIYYADWQERQGHAMAVRSDGTLVIAGGSNLNDVWISDLSMSIGLFPGLPGGTR
eukprot:UN3450